MIKIFFFTLIICPFGFATDNCLEISTSQMEAWMSHKPMLPDFNFLLQAKKIIDNESKYALKLGNDKRAHCYLGCRISEEVSFETAQYAAWQKEYNDATDCNSKSKFEIADYEATIVGAKFSSKAMLKTKKSCADYCKKVY